MSYRIEYDCGVGKYEVRQEEKARPKIWACVGVLLAAALVLWPQGAVELRSLLIPGDDAITVQAFQTMTDDLRSGATISDAVETFCRFVIHGE